MGTKVANAARKVIAAAGSVRAAVVGKATRKADSNEFIYECPVVDAIVRLWNRLTGGRSQFHLEWKLDRTKGIGKTMYKLAKKEGPLQHWGKGPGMILLCVLVGLLSAGCSLFKPATIAAAPPVIAENLGDLGKQARAEGLNLRQLAAYFSGEIARVKPILEANCKEFLTSCLVVATEINAAAGRQTALSGKLELLSTQAVALQKALDAANARAKDAEARAKAAELRAKQAEAEAKAADLSLFSWLMQLGAAACAVLVVICGIVCAFSPALIGKLWKAAACGAAGAAICLGLSRFAPTLAWIGFGAALAAIAAGIGFLIWELVKHMRDNAALAAEADKFDAEADSMAVGIQNAMPKLTPSDAETLGAHLAKAQDEAGTRTLVRARREELGQVEG